MGRRESTALLAHDAEVVHVVGAWAQDPRERPLERGVWGLERERNTIVFVAHNLRVAFHSVAAEGHGELMAAADGGSHDRFDERAAEAHVAALPKGAAFDLKWEGDAKSSVGAPHRWTILAEFRDWTTAGNSC
jgi:hypothetical protein